MTRLGVITLVACFAALGCDVNGSSNDDDADLQEYVESENAMTDTESSSNEKTEAEKEKDTESGEERDSDIDTVDLCGNGFLDENEACDDGGIDDSDGCSGDCLEVAEGYSCIPPGKACHLLALCGDGQVQPPELCDDGGRDSGDGCSENCQVEVGYKCDTTVTPSDCTVTECGDGLIEGAESCDDANTVPFDGCSASCQREPDCSGGACISECGDGLVLGASEACDDGNTVSGDGCSADCEVELGYTCTQETCDDTDCVLRVPVIFRDFLEEHPDFQIPSNCMGEIPGLVESVIGVDGRPVATETAMDNCVTQLSDWYTNDSALFGVTVPYKVSELVLYPNGDGGFVNRYGADGERWLGYEIDAVTGQGVEVEPMVDDVADCVDDECIPCAFDPEQGCPAPTVEFDGNPLFFPVDDMASAEFFDAGVPPEYGWTDFSGFGGGGWYDEAEVTGVETQHNFHFTSEVTYWFRYEDSMVATFDFAGDDDVWVFVNGRLAVDLGGVHAPVFGSVTISAENSFGMEGGSVYEIRVFHAERLTIGSSFKLTLKGFNSARSVCVPRCGDGILGIGEECDDGINAGGYAHCNAECKYDGYCGDGILQEEYEDCDDGNFFNGDACPSSCRDIQIIAE